MRRTKQRRRQQSCRSVGSVCNRRGIAMAKVAFIGLGRMGSGMARRALDCGHQLRVFNRNAARADELIRRGAIACATPREACEGTDAIVSMVADDDASRAVWYGANGALA